MTIIKGYYKTMKKKKLIIINGTMGVGKTFVCKILYKQIHNSIFLDGDWCWEMNPWNTNEENKNMVLDNISYLLNNFLKNTTIENIIFCWVLHEETIIKNILDKLLSNNYKLYIITLMCSEKELIKRMENDKRDKNSISNSINRIKLYKNMKTNKINTDNKGIEEIVKEIKIIIKE
jgi:broad-specificity NMP kinase